MANQYTYGAFVVSEKWIEPQVVSDPWSMDDRRQVTPKFSHHIVNSKYGSYWQRQRFCFENSHMEQYNCTFVQS